MKVVILAGGFGTRLSELTGLIPKPMVPIDGKPILWHIMDSYAQFGFNEFVVALGYRADIVKSYFSSLHLNMSDFSIDLQSGQEIILSPPSVNWRVSLIDTGLNTMTGGRLKRLSDVLDDTFLLTYGDGLSNVPIPRVVELHKANSAMVTVTAVRPIARFGEVVIEGSRVQNFTEKPQVGQGWINGGFFVVEPDFLDLIESDQTVLEQKPLEKVAKLGRMQAYMHEGFWQCMDTKRDHDLLNELSAQSPPPWKQV